MTPRLAQIYLNTSESTASWSAASATESLAFTVLDPASSSIWSPIPTESGVRAGVVSNIQPTNSLQGFVDHDPCDALPSSVADLDLGNGRWTGEKDASKTSTAQEEAKLRAAASSFSSFFPHESAAAFDPAAAVANPDHPRARSSFGPAAWHGRPPPTPPSLVSAYSPTQSFSLYTFAPPNYGRTLSQQQVYSARPTQMPPPYPPQRLAQPYSSQHYPSASLTSTAVGYSTMPYRDSASSAAPHGITNSALVASYSYGGQGEMSLPRVYGSVGMPGTAGCNSDEGRGQRGRREGVDGPPTLL